MITGAYSRWLSAQELDAAQMPVHQGSEAVANLRRQEHTRLWGICLIQTLALYQSGAEWGRPGYAIGVLCSSVTLANVHVEWSSYVPLCNNT
jgi:hypothetical protein